MTHKDNSMTFLLIAIMSQIIYKEFISFYFTSILLVTASQESCVGIVANMSTLGICFKL